MGSAGLTPVRERRERSMGNRRDLVLYLAGPITGLGFESASLWRKQVEKQLTRSAPHIRCVNPLRAKEYLHGLDTIDAGAYRRSPLGESGIVARDLWDIRRADIVLMNLAGCQGASVGSMIELGWAAAHGLFIVIVLSDDDDASSSANPHDHVFVRQAASVIVKRLEDAVEIVEAL